MLFTLALRSGDALRIQRERHRESFKRKYLGTPNKEMSVRLRAIYKDGAFIPITNGDELDVPENAEVELIVQNPVVLPATAINEDERERALRTLVESWEQHQLAPDAPRLTRDELHERR